MASTRWQEQSLENDRWIRESFGSLDLHLLSTREEWRIASPRQPAGQAPADPAAGDVDSLPPELEWTRWDRGPDDRSFRLRPVFPDRPVIVRPSGPLHLSPRSHATFFVGIPAFIEVSAECEGDMLQLTTLPVETLSNSWHGSPTSGRLAYAAITHARRRHAPDQWPPWSIVCTIDIVNEGSDTLPFERLLLDTRHLAVFEAAGQLVANAVRIRVGRDRPDLSDLTYAPRPVADFGEAAELSPPRAGRARRSKISQAFASVIGNFQSSDDQ